MVPLIYIAAPVVILFNVSSGVFSKSITHCMLFIVEPSFKAIKRLLLKVLTHPLIITSCKTEPDFNNSATLFFVIICKCIVFGNYLFIKSKDTLLLQIKQPMKGQ